MPKRYLTALAAALALLFAPVPSASAQESWPWEALDIYLRMNDAVSTHTERRERERQRATEQRQEEEAVRRQQEELRTNPGSYPRQRFSYEAEQNENPWAREAERKTPGPKPVRVEIFVAEKCPDCESMEKFLDGAGVPYSRLFLERGSEAYEQYLAQIGRGLLPATRVNGRVVRGYEPDQVRKIILEEKEGKSGRQ